MTDWYWWACEQPERPTDAYVLWHYTGCPGCRIKADVLARLYPDDDHVQWLHRLTNSGGTS